MQIGQATSNCFYPSVVRFLMQRPLHTFLLIPDPFSSIIEHTSTCRTAERGILHGRPSESISDSLFSFYHRCKIPRLTRIAHGRCVILVAQNHPETFSPILLGIAISPSTSLCHRFFSLTFFLCARDLRRSNL